MTVHGLGGTGESEARHTSPPELVPELVPSSFQGSPPGESSPKRQPPREKPAGGSPDRHAWEASRPLNRAQSQEKRSKRGT